MVIRVTIANLTKENALLRSTEKELLLARQRLDVGQVEGTKATPESWRPLLKTPFSCALDQIPEIEANAVSVDTIGNGIHHHGAVIVRNFFSTELAASYREQMDAAFIEQDQYDEAPEKRRDWFNPPEELLNHPFCQSRGMVRNTGSMWALNSPRLMFNLLQEYDRLGLKEICHSYFGETPMLSVKKWVLRKIRPLGQPSDWHQDGAFMGADVKSINLWVALSECGGTTDTPGLDIKPGRINRIVDTGTDGAAFQWSVGEQAADEAFASAHTVTPHFNEGDAIFFDHFNLHRTAFDTDHQSTRYAIECWFLGLSNYPERQIPLVW